MKKVVEKVAELAAPVVGKLGLELWDVEYIKEAGQWFLRVYIDKSGGIAIEDCEAFSRAFDPILDEADPIAESYVFEVSSAGAERALKRPSDFERFMGSNVAVHLYKPKDGKKEFIGTLKSYNNGDLEIENKNGVLAFTKSEVALVRLRISL
jgi:ribosome maturation factor RimP